MLQQPKILKRCYRCHKDKETNEFHKCSSYKDGLNNICKICAREKVDAWTELNRVRKNETQRQWNREHPNAKREWDSKNKEHIRKWAKEYWHIKKMDPSKKLAVYLRTRIGKIVRRDSKRGSAVRDLGCSVEELKVRLEGMFYQNIDGTKMTWDNYGEWHVDHIVPLCSFDLTDREQFLKACHYTNLQPLRARDNLTKREKMPGVWRSENPNLGAVVVTTT